MRSKLALNSLGHYVLALVVCIFGTLCLSACSSESSDPAIGAKATPVQKPNVIVILADDMRANYTGFEGHPLIRTPNIDALAAKSVYFSNSFATSAVCTPSRTTLLTGQYERKHGVNFNSDSVMSEAAYNETYPMLLRKFGYFVGYVGKNHTPIGRSDAGVLGYRSGVMDKSFDYWYASHGHLGFYPKEVERHAIFKNAKSDTQAEIISEGMETFFTPNEAFQAGYDFIDSRPSDQPFALLINFNIPHNGGTGSMEMRDSDSDLYKTAYRDQIDNIKLPSSYIAHTDVTTPKLPLNVYNGEYITNYNYVQTREAMLERDIRTIQTVTGIDRLLGKLMTRLEEQGIADNTIIVFTSDHGLLHGEHGLGGKSLVYEPAIRIPMFVFDPRAKTASTSDELVALVDIAPTLLDLVGAPVPDGMQGKSMKPLIMGAQTEWRDELFIENMMTIQNYPRIEAVRTKKWKYARYFSRDKDQEYEAMLSASIMGEQPIYEELFDLVNDPDEIHNVAGGAEHKALLNRLRESTSTLVKKHRGGEPLTTLPKTPCKVNAKTGMGC